MTRLEGYRFGHVRVDGEEHTKDVIVLPDRVLPRWWRQDGHGLVMDDLADVIEDLPPTLVVGTGADARMVPDPNTIQELEGRGLSVEVLPTAEAVKRFGELDPATTAAALHLTC